ncbi:uveal autoantigen with coiled-coil domains and ankyrin repeats protein-like isoform X2 [Mauremys mutica]|uniref:uveal autoantigen with coiled-coil domains and ankyrin repeats protein-like isoform X2 n=1 Tax=Mauremys mutica TaxID=74926 RepID=UPI001D166BF1|nr:uveal autoantigen with coiled-coil domains and ankyrin repeats protein-like isoform X2 [Mauremys mutica]
MADEKKEAIRLLAVEMLNRQHCYKEKYNHTETFKDRIDQRTKALHSTQEDLKKTSKKYSQQHEQIIQKFKDKVDCHQNEKLEIMKYQYNEKSSKVEECERIIWEQKAESANALDQQTKKYVLETEKLGKTLQSLHLDVIASQQKHKVELAQLEQQITQLERDLTDAKKLCSQKDQAIRKRDDLLTKSEADLLQAREGIKAKVAEVEHLDSVVKKLKASIQDTQKEKNQKKIEAIILRTEIQQLNQELQDVHKQYRETAPELASQDEKLLLMESSLKGTQEQLSEQITETVRQEQNSRKSQTELNTLREHIIASEEGIRDYNSASLKNSANKRTSKGKLSG